MEAANRGHGAIVTYLMEQGANKDLQNNVSIHLLRMIMMMMMLMMIMIKYINKILICFLISKFLSFNSYNQ